MNQKSQQIIESFKNEFNRLGNPGYVKYAKHYNRTNAPSIREVQNALNIIQWSDILDALNLSIDDKRGRHRKKYHSQKQLMNALKKEIIRLGIKNNPQITIYRKNYDKNLAPCANTVLQTTGKTWRELMDELGFYYTTPTRKYDKILQDKEGLIEKIITIMHEKNILTSSQLRSRLKSEIDIPYTSLHYRGIDWDAITKAYSKKYNVELKSRKTYKNKTTLDIMPAKYLLQELFEIVNKKSINKLEDASFMKNYYAEHRFGTSDLNKLKTIYESIK